MRLSHSRQIRSGAAAVVLAVAGSATTTPATAEHATGRHWHDRPVVYRLNENLAPNREQIHNAAEKWTTQTRFNLTHGGLITHNEWERDSHIAWRGNLPGAFAIGCGSAAVACTAATTRSGTDHLLDADTVFNNDYVLFEGLCGTNQPNFFSAHAVSLHEFGHWARLSHADNVESVMTEPNEGNDCSLSDHDVGAVENLYEGH
jgi:hypothetical protein